MIRFRYLAAACLACLAATPALAADLVVDIEDIHAQGGRITVFLFDSEAAWKGTRDALGLRRVHPDGTTRQQVRFDGLRAGRYGVIVLHDRDGNGKFDVGLFGIPKDDYGFSNNPVVFRKPTFEQVGFTVPAAGQRISVRMK